MYYDTEQKKNTAKIAVELFTFPRAVWSKRLSERCNRMSKRTSECSRVARFMAVLNHGGFAHPLDNQISEEKEMQERRVIFHERVAER